MTECKDRFRVVLDKHKVESWIEDKLGDVIPSWYQKKWINLKKAVKIAE